jgi:hypothetical protein
MLKSKLIANQTLLRTIITWITSTFRFSKTPNHDKLSDLFNSQIFILTFSTKKEPLMNAISLSAAEITELTLKFNIKVQEMLVNGEITSVISLI